MIVHTDQQFEASALRQAIYRQSDGVSLLPDSAPFTTEQRAWLNGFFAGLLGIASATETQHLELTDGNGHDAPPNSNVKPETGASETFPWHDPAMSLDERMRLAEHRPFERQLMAAMAQLDCGACGYLCKTYSEAIACGTEANLGLCAPGGAPTARAIKRLLKQNSSADVQPVAASPVAATDASRRPAILDARISNIRRLTAGTSTKHVCHVEMEVVEGEFSYECGDALAVTPRNCPQLVSSLVDMLQRDNGGALMTRDGRQQPLDEVLRDACDLHQVTDELLQLLITTAPQSSSSGNLQKWLDEGLPEGLDVLDVLANCDDAAMLPDASSLVQTLAPLMPRYYSIASSPLVHQRAVHLTVGRVATTVRERERKGVASTMFCERLAVGDAVRVSVKSAPEFRLPANGDVPLIMIGPGTGIAPFIGFLQQRQAQAARGGNWLFFGEQHRATEFLYEQELAAFQRSGVLQRLDVAFSRDQAEKVYVQHRMLERAADLMDWLEGGATVYVCGDARRMARDVDRALHEIIQRTKAVTADFAAQYVADLKAAGRYRRDVY